MNHKAAAFVALLAAASLVLIPLGAVDSSGDGGVQRGEGAGEGFSMEYTSSPVPYIDFHFDKSQSKEFRMVLSGPGDYLEMGPFPMKKEITILLQDGDETPHPLVIGDYTVLITGISGEQYSDCIMKVYPAYIITFDPNGGSGSMDRQFVEKGKSYTLPECGFNAPLDMGFDSWKIGESQYKPGESVSIASNSTLKAIWKESSNDGFPIIIAIGAAAIVAALALVVIMIGRKRI